MSAISFNITEEALASTQGGDYGVVPAGSYEATVFEVKSETVRSGPNEGKPRYNIQFKLSGEGVNNRRVFGYVALYVANDFWKTQSFFSALGYDMKSGKFVVPEPSELAGKPIGVRVKVGKDQNGADRNEIGGFDKPTASAGADAALASIGAVATGDVF